MTKRHVSLPATAGRQTFIEDDAPMTDDSGVKIKWGSVAEPLDGDGSDDRKRRLPYDLPENVETFDGFGRSLSPSDGPDETER
ncbi:MAG: hypothetical protein PPP58_06960 [Natronomonas sp.]